MESVDSSKLNIVLTINHKFLNKMLPFFTGLRYNEREKLAIFFQILSNVTYYFLVCGQRYSFGIYIFDFVFIAFCKQIDIRRACNF